MSEPANIWVITLRPLPDDSPAEIRVRHLLKHALRSLRLRCLKVAGQEDAAEQIAKLQQIIRQLADRVASQAELLTRHAEKQESAA